MTMRRAWVSVLATGALLLTTPPWTSLLAQRPPSAAGDWPHYAADAAATHYSVLDQITRDNVAGLKQVWEWKPGETALPQFGTRPGAFQNTPLMIDGVLYVSTPYNQAVALDADTGRER